MIPKKIQALFDFIDYLDSNKKEYIENYIPLITEQKLLDEKRQKLKPFDNYKKRQQYNNIQTEISEKSTLIKNGIGNPILNKLKELKIWAGDDTFASIWNNISAISELKENFTEEDIVLILQHKKKYLSFRKETNTYFLCLDFAINALDEVLKELFDFFKDTKENEFENFETKTIEVGSIKEAANILSEPSGKHVRISIPIETIFAKQETAQTHSTNIKNEIIMGNKIETGNISNHSGQLVIGDNNQNRQNIIETKSDDKIAEKSFHWQKWGIIIATVLAIIVIIVTITLSK